MSKARSENLFHQGWMSSASALKGAAFVCLFVGGSNTSGFAAAQLVVEPITWDVIGLDSNSVNTGPAEYPVGARVRNVGDTAASNVQVKFNWMTANQHINLTPAALGTTDLLSSPSLAPGASGLFYFNVTVNRTPAAHLTARRFQITATADSTTPASGPVRELFVEKILSQSRNDVLSFTGPTSVQTGDIVQYVLKAKTATNGYEQLQVFINFPNTFFRIISINARYSAPRPGYTNNIDYADACGWDSNPNSPTYRSCVGPCLTSSCKAGGNIDTVYTVQVIRDIDTTVSLTTLIHDFSGSSYHYNSDFGVVAIIEPSTNLTIAKTAVPDVVEAGDEFEYMVTAVNVGAKSADNVKVTDTLPSGITFLSSTPAPDASPATPRTWSFGTLPSGGTRTITIRTRAECSAIPNGSRSVTRTNTAIVATTTKETNTNDNTATASVTVQDTANPVISCPPDQCVNATRGVCAANIDPGTATASDNCGSVTVAGKRDDGLPLSDPYPVGTTVITWTATDSHTNQTSCTQNITYGIVTCPSVN